MISASTTRPQSPSKRVWALLLAVVVVWVAASLVHELAHGLTAAALGGKFLWCAVWPGIEVWPNPGRAYEGEWGTSIAKTAYATGAHWGDWQDGLVLLMGSASNLLFAALALGCLWFFRPRGWPRVLLVAETLMLEDILLYALLPEVFGLRHYLVFGGSKPEPVNGAELLGCPRPLFVVLVIGVCALMIRGLVAYVRGSDVCRPDPPSGRICDPI